MFMTMETILVCTMMWDIHVSGDDSQ